jgi:hypothetical protein
MTEALLKSLGKEDRERSVGARAWAHDPVPNGLKTKDVKKIYGNYF